MMVVMQTRVRQCLQRLMDNRFMMKKSNIIQIVILIRVRSITETKRILKAVDQVMLNRRKLCRHSPKSYQIVTEAHDLQQRTFVRYNRSTFKLSVRIQSITAREKLILSHKNNLNFIHLVHIF